MTKKIYRYPLAIQGEQRVRMPKGAYVISAGVAPTGEVSVWALVDPEASPIERTFFVVGTGNPVWEEVQRAAFVGTVVGQARPQVWHIFQESP